MGSMEPYVAGAVAGFLAHFLIKQITRRASPKSTGGKFMIAPSRKIVWFSMVAGVIFLVIGIFAIVMTQMIVGPQLIFIVLGAAISGLAIPSLSPTQIVQWDAKGLEGPCTMAGPIIGFSRTKIAWDQVIAISKGAAGHRFVEAKDGRRIYWSFVYSGYPALHDALRQNCPQLFGHLSLS